MFQLTVKNFSAKIILTILLLSTFSTLTMVLPEGFQSLKIVHAQAKDPVNVTYRLLAVETWFGYYYYMWSGEDLIQNLTRFNNWNNGSTTVGSTTYNFRSYIHLLTENQRSAGPWTYAGNSSKNNIINEIKNFLAATGPDENNSLTIRIFYYIGHSGKQVLSNGTIYYLSNLSPNKNESLTASMLNETLCYGDLATNNCTLIILDTCYAGQMIGNLTRLGRVILAGDNSTESSVWGWTYYPPKTTLQWGWFTGNENAYNQTYSSNTYWTMWGPVGIISGLLNGNDSNKDGWRSAGEVFTFANTSTINYATHNNDSGHPYGYSQHPSAYYGVFAGGIPLVQHNASAAFPYNTVVTMFFIPPKTSWWRWRGGATGIGYAPVDPGFTLLWEKTLNFPLDSSPTIADGLVFIGESGSDVSTFYALDMRTGDVVWASPIGFSARSTAAVSDGLVFFGAGPRVYALDEGTGFVRWVYYVPTGAEVISSPLVLDGKVIFGAVDGYVRALDEFTGSWLWDYSTGAPVISSPSGMSGLAVYVGSMNGRVYALNIDNGLPLWEFDTLSPGVVSSPAVADGMVFFGSLGGTVFALSLSGTPIWTRTVPSEIRSSPAVDPLQKILVIGAENGVAYAYNSTSGDGPLWTFTTGGPIGMSSPAISGDGSVYIGSQDGYLYCLNETSGLPIWDYLIGGIISSPAIVGGHIYASSANSKICAFGPPFLYHNLIMWNVSVSTNATVLGETINITAIVINEGNVSETFDVDFGFWNSTIFEPTEPNGSAVTAPIHITTLHIANLLPGANITLYTHWNTSLNPPANLGVYYVFAEAKPSTFEEFNVADNIAASSPISITTLPTQWSQVCWSAVGSSYAMVLGFEGWVDVPELSVTVEFPSEAVLTVVYSVGPVLSSAGGQIRVLVNDVPKQTVSVLGSKYGDTYYATVLQCYAETVEAGVYAVRLQWCASGAFDYLLNDPSGSPGFMHRVLYVVAQDDPCWCVFGVSDDMVMGFEGWKDMLEMSLTFDTAVHNVTVIYSTRLISNAGGQVRILISGVEKRVDTFTPQLGGYDTVLGSYTELLPAGTYTVKLQWWVPGYTDWAVCMPAAWPNIMHRELYLIVNAP